MPYLGLSCFHENETNEAVNWSDFSEKALRNRLLALLYGDLVRLKRALIIG